MIPVILSGGSGSRLWPASRALYPKQFLNLASTRSLFQGTLDRLAGLEGLAAPMVVCNEEHRFIVAEQLRDGASAGKPSIVLEPAGRNTAPAIAVAATLAIAAGDDPVLLVLPADHLISDVGAFHAGIAVALAAAQAGSLVTFGIKPTGPETGYGYIKARVGQPGKAWALEKFVEKPDLATARRYVDSGEYFWNSGMFMFRASAYLAELERHAPQMLQACRAAVAAGTRDLDFVRLGSEEFAACASDSIDYAVMEKTDKAMMICLDAGWSDVGSWSALWEVGDKDANGNVLQGDVIAVDTRNSFVFSTDGRLVATVGLEDMIVVEAPDAVLVARKDSAQDVKQVVEALTRDGRPEAKNHRKVYRPWGCYDSIDSGPRYQVKRITVNPGQKLSVQLHHHRAEHWIVVSGTAKVQNGDKEMMLTENQSTYISVGVVHSLENPGKIPLELIEVQSGAYLGEDDIVRFKDRYGRA